MRRASPVSDEGRVGGDRVGGIGRVRGNVEGVGRFAVHKIDTCPKGGERRSTDEGRKEILLSKVSPPLGQRAIRMTR